MMLWDEAPNEVQLLPMRLRRVESRPKLCVAGEGRKGWWWGQLWVAGECRKGWWWQRQDQKDHCSELKKKKLNRTKKKYRSSPGKTTVGKVPKRIHKAEREKMKREHLNELFLDLANALDLNEQNSGKACVLSEAARLLKDLLGQIESLKKENMSLLSESHYVTMEKNELKEETSSLETQIAKLQVEIQARVAQSKPDLNVPPPHAELDPPQQPDFPGQSLQFSTIEPTLQQEGPAVLVVPYRPDLQAAFPAPNVVEVPPKPASVISKPHPRYPTPADSWPSLLLGQQPTSN